MQGELRPEQTDASVLVIGLKRGPDGIWFAPFRAPVSYPAHGNAACLQVEDRSFWFRHRNACLVSTIHRFAPSGTLLDIGGGNGYVARGLIRAGIACALLEPGIEGAVAAKERGIDPVLCARLEDLECPPGCLAAAGMFDVLEHIEDDIGTLQRVNRLLAPSGRLFLTVPAYAFLTSADDVAAGHYRRYTLRSLARALARTGFRVAYATYLFAPLTPLVLLLRTLPSLLHLRRAEDAELKVSDHVREGLSARAMNRLLHMEARRIEAGGSIPFGTSCMAVGIKD
jgi:SAM-dependent methyltransferase